MTRARANLTRRPERGGASYSREFLERLARILVNSGHSPRELAREFREICGKLREPARRWDPGQLTYLTDLPGVIAHWHSDPQYLDSRAKPRPLPLKGPGASLCALIERVLPEEDPIAVAKSLTRLQGVRRRDRLYIPRGRYFTYPRSSGRIYGLTPLLGMLRTVERNVSGSKSAPLLERAALNAGFPVRALPAFYRRIEKQAEELLWNTDGDMRRREASGSKGPRTRLGVGIFAFEAPLKSRKAPAKRGTRRRHR